jgi:hypothetical protein
MTRAALAVARRGRAARFATSAVLLSSAFGGWRCAPRSPNPEQPNPRELRERAPEPVASGRADAGPARSAPSSPVASTRSILWQAPPPATGATVSPAVRDREGGPACAKLRASAPELRACTRGKERGIEDPEGRCDPELELVRPLGKVYSRPFDPVSLLSRDARGFLVLNWMKLEPLSVKNDGAREEGASIVELSTAGAPIRQCFATSTGGSGAATGIRDGALDSRGRLALTGWIWGSDLSFGGERISAPKGYRSSFLAVLTESGSHAFSTAVGGPTWNDASSVAVDAKGNVAVAGSFFGTLKLGALELPAVESKALYVAKLDAGGRVLWVHLSPLAQGHVAPAVAFTRTGDMVVVGGYDQHLDFGAPLPRATPLGLSGCASAQRPPDAQRMYWVELDVNGRQTHADSFGAPYAAASDVTTTPEGDVIVNGTFRGRLPLGGAPLLAPEPGADCGCDVDCARPPARFVARFDEGRRLLFREAMPSALIVRATGGIARSTVLEQGIPVSFRNAFGSRLPDDYRWQLEIRSADGGVRWSRSFEKLDLKASAAVGAGRLAVLLHDPEKKKLYFAVYRTPLESAAATK